MKKLLTLLLAAALAMSLAACGGEKDTDSDANSEDKTISVKVESGTVKSDEDGGDKIAEEYDEPIVLLDSGDVKIVATSKLSRQVSSTQTRLGYTLEIENNSDEYINIYPVNMDMDGFMLDNGHYMDISTVAPGKKAKTLLYFKAGETNSVEINSIEDVHDLDGLWQIMYSEDGSSYSSKDDNINYPFENILP